MVWQEFHQKEFDKNNENQMYELMKIRRETMRRDLQDLFEETIQHYCDEFRRKYYAEYIHTIDNLK